MVVDRHSELIDALADDHPVTDMMSGLTSQSPPVWVWVATGLALDATVLFVLCKILDVS